MTSLPHSSTGVTLTLLLSLISRVATDKSGRTTTHMWRRFEVELQKRGDHWGALKEALDTTGVALMLSATTTMAGFAVLLFSPMPIIQDFGLITAITVLFSLVLALMVLPVLVELAARGQESVGEDEAV